MYRIANSYPSLLLKWSYVRSCNITEHACTFLIRLCINSVSVLLLLGTLPFETHLSNHRGTTHCLLLANSSLLYTVFSCKAFNKDTNDVVYRKTVKPQVSQFAFLPHFLLCFSWSCKSEIEQLAGSLTWSCLIIANKVFWSKIFQNFQEIFRN